MIRIKIEDESGATRDVEIPEGISLSLMEVLKASEYDILATCGGMALCATCHVEVVQTSEPLDDPADVELEMIDTLPDASADSRLACQIRVGPHLDGAVFRLRGVGV